MAKTQGQLQNEVMMAAQCCWLAQLEAKATSLGLPIWNLVVWMYNNPTARDKFFADCAAGNVFAAINDLIADYQAANP